VLVNSLNPDRIAGQKTAVFELVEELGRAPDAVYLPYGGGGNTTAYALGFAELELSCRLVPAEAADRRRTLATAIRIADPAHAAAVARTGAAVVSVADQEIVAAWRDLARLEGVFCEPASAAPLAALRRSPPAPGSLVVCVVTGHGLKDADAVAAHTRPALEVEPNPDALAEAAA
jgi:threonine synthase